MFYNSLRRNVENVCTQNNFKNWNFCLVQGKEFPGCCEMSRCEGTGCPGHLTSTLDKENFQVVLLIKNLSAVHIKFKVNESLRQMERLASTLPPKTTGVTVTLTSGVTDDWSHSGNCSAGHSRSHLCTSEHMRFRCITCMYPGRKELREEDGESKKKHLFILSPFISTSWNPLFSSYCCFLHWLNVSVLTLFEHKNRMSAFWTALGSASWRRWRSPSVFFIFLADPTGVSGGRYHSLLLFERQAKIYVRWRDCWSFAQKNPFFSKPQTWFRSDNGGSHENPLWTVSSVLMICRQHRKTGSWSRTFNAPLLFFHWLNTKLIKQHIL